MTYRIENARLSDRRMMFAEMAGIQTAELHFMAMDTLAAYADAGAWTALVHGGAGLAGINVTLPASYFKPAVDLCAALNLDLDTTVVDTMTYIQEDHRGQGLAKKMRTSSYQQSRARGMKTMLGYGYQSRQILDWARHIYGDALTTKVDHKGDPVFVVAL